MLQVQRKRSEGTGEAAKIEVDEWVMDSHACRKPINSAFQAEIRALSTLLYKDIMSVRHYGHKTTCLPFET
jgi:hypothetical protein